MRLSLIMALGVAALTACSAGDADRVARDAAKGVVNRTLESRFPGTNTALMTDCIIDNAEITEVYTIAEAAVVGPSAETSSLILDIATRPDTVRCAADNALAAFVLGGS
ncbi:succinate dehydrogenase [Loktanella agnita]|uniref:succinate dehydrogenase n=1 Tax=Loktanella agnita TaxID=287097 RepID=UPI0039888C42